MSKPQQTFQIGLEKTAVFENEGEHGKYLNAQLEGRRYKDGEEWKTSHSYNASQLAKHIALCQSTLNYMITEAPTT